MGGHATSVLIFMVHRIPLARISYGIFKSGMASGNYSNDSFDYNTNPVINALQRYGLSNSLTLETQAEITNDVLIQGGAGLSWLTSPVTELLILMSGEASITVMQVSNQELVGSGIVII